jgi:hypothetical protein
MIRAHYEHYTTESEHGKPSDEHRFYDFVAYARLYPSELTSQSYNG